jgi:hypothetical protein
MTAMAREAVGGARETLVNLDGSCRSASTLARYATPAHILDGWDCKLRLTAAEAATQIQETP